MPIRRQLLGDLGLSLVTQEALERERKRRHLIGEQTHDEPLAQEGIVGQGQDRQQTRLDLENACVKR